MCVTTLYYALNGSLKFSLMRVLNLASVFQPTGITKLLLIEKIAKMSFAKSLDRKSCR